MPPARSGRGQRRGRGGGARGQKEVEPPIGAGGEASVDGALEGMDLYHHVVIVVVVVVEIQIIVGIQIIFGIQIIVDGGEGAGHGKGGRGAVPRIVVGLGVVVGIVVVISIAAIVIVIVVAVVVVATAALGPPRENREGTRNRSHL